MDIEKDYLDILMKQLTKLVENKIENVFVCVFIVSVLLSNILEGTHVRMIGIIRDSNFSIFFKFYCIKNR